MIVYQRCSGPYRTAVQAETGPDRRFPSGPVRNFCSSVQTVERLYLARNLKKMKPFLTLLIDKPL